MLGRVGHRRIAVSIVPSTGFFTARYAASLAERNALREIVALGQRLGGAAHDLRQDHARVAARAHQRGARDLLARAPARSSGPSLLRAPRRPRARSASGSCRCRRREPDRRSGRRSAGGAPRSRPARPRSSSQHALLSCALPHPLDDDLDRRDGQAGDALDLVADLRAHRRGDLGEVQAVLDDDVHLDAQRARIALDR